MQCSDSVSELFYVHVHCSCDVERARGFVGSVVLQRDSLSCSFPPSEVLVEFEPCCRIFDYMYIKNDSSTICRKSSVFSAVSYHGKRWQAISEQIHFKKPMSRYDFSVQLSSWCIWFSDKSVEDVLQHLSANHEQELCLVHTITCVRVTIVKKNHII